MVSKIIRSQVIRTNRIDVEFVLGTDIIDAAKEAMAVYLRTGTPVYFTFNNVPLVADKTKSASLICYDYHNNMK